MTKDCKTCPFLVMCSAPGWSEGLLKFSSSVKQTATPSPQGQCTAHMKLWLWLKQKSGSWKESKCTFPPVTVWFLHLPDGSFILAVNPPVCPVGKNGSPAFLPLCSSPYWAPWAGSGNKFTSQKRHKELKEQLWSGWLWCGCTSGNASTSNGVGTGTQGSWDGRITLGWWPWSVQVA